MTFSPPFVLLGQRANHTNGNELAKLIESGGIIFGWLGVFHTGFFGRKPFKANHFLFAQIISMG